MAAHDGKAQQRVGGRTSHHKRDQTIERHGSGSTAASLLVSADRAVSLRPVRRAARIRFSSDHACSAERCASLATALRIAAPAAPAGVPPRAARPPGPTARLLGEA